MGFKERFHQFSEDNSGQFAVTTAVLALPMLLAVSLAVDTHLVERDRTKLKSALDAAVIAAITDQTITSAERAMQAENRFWVNLAKKEGVSVNVVKSESYRVELEAKMRTPTLFASMIGKDTIDFKQSSAAELVKGATVCMLALDPDSARSFEVTEGAILDANCSIQVNSLHKQASVIDLGGKATAQNFCVGGGAEGDYYPYVNTECSTLEDPYTAVKVPIPGECVNPEKLNELMLDWRSGRDSVDEHEVLEGERTRLAAAEGRVWYPTYFEKIHLSPGNYCDGLFLEGKEFILDPGVYHITDGSLVFGKGTELKGEGVTFVLHGTTDIEIRDGSILDIKGPASGPMEGLVIAQDMSKLSIDNPSYPNVTSSITEGAKLNLLGTVYLPTHKIEFLGGSLAKTHAPATSFIAHQISIRDGANIGVSADHLAADIPPIKPRSDDGARLVK